MRPSRPVFLLAYFRLTALLGLAPFLVNTADILLHPLAAPLDAGFGQVSRVGIGLLVAPLTLAIAVLVIRRAPGNVVGWALVSFSYGQSVQVVRGGLLPLAPTVLIASSLITQFWFAFIIIPLFFPDGQLFPPAVRRWGNRIITFSLIFILLIAQLSNKSISWGATGEKIPNPLQVFDWDIRPVSISWIMALVAAGVGVVILRYRASRGVERLQIRWMLFGVLLQLFLAVVTLMLPPSLKQLNVWVSLPYALIAPVAVGIAMLRYRLWDIDLVIRRTLQYGLLSALLGLAYFGLVVLLGQVFRALTGQDSPLAVVLSTLVIAAAFNPIRRIVQDFIDRRFFRARYDADRAAASFSEAARRQVELEKLAGQLASTAQEAFQPEDVWVWIRTSKAEGHGNHSVPKQGV